MTTQKPVAYRFPDPDVPLKHHYFDPVELAPKMIAGLEPLYTKSEDSEILDWLEKSDWYIGPEYHSDEAGGINGFENHNIWNLRQMIRAQMKK